MTLADRILAVLPFTWIDAVALGLFLALWAGYQWYADY